MNKPKRIKKHRYYQLKGSTMQAEKTFARMVERMGNIVRITGTYTVRQNYRVRLTNDKGEQFIFGGFGFFYSGTGSRGLVKCLKMIGVNAEWLLNHEFRGDTYNNNSFFINI